MFPPMNVTRNPIFSFPSRKDKKKKKKKKKKHQIFTSERLKLVIFEFYF